MGASRSNSGDPFDNSLGFHFPPRRVIPDFPANDPVITHLLIAQAHIPPTELVEVAGFTGTAGTIGPRFDAFDDGKGGIVPLRTPPAFVMNLFVRPFSNVSTEAPIGGLVLADYLRPWRTAVRSTSRCSDEQSPSSNSC